MKKITKTIIITTLLSASLLPINLAFQKQRDSNGAVNKSTCVSNLAKISRAKRLHWQTNRNRNPLGNVSDGNNSKDIEALEDFFPGNGFPTEPTTNLKKSYIVGSYISIPICVAETENSEPHNFQENIKAKAIKKSRFRLTSRGFGINSPITSPKSIKAWSGNSHIEHGGQFKIGKTKSDYVIAAHGTAISPKIEVSEEAKSFYADLVIKNLNNEKIADLGKALWRVKIFYKTKPPETIEANKSINSKGIGLNSHFFIREKDDELITHIQLILEVRQSKPIHFAVLGIWASSNSENFSAIQNLIEDETNKTIKTKDQKPQKEEGVIDEKEHPIMPSMNNGDEE